MKTTKLWTGPVQKTYLGAGAYGGEEASISVLQPGNMPASGFLGARHPTKNWWTWSPAACPTRQPSVPRGRGREELPAACSWYLRSWSRRTILALC